MSRESSAAVVGLGFGANHARVLTELEGVHLAAVCDSDPDRLKAVSKARGATAYADYKEMLRRERLDAVIVAVPAALHVEVGLAAIENGCAVLVEKPLAASYAEGCRLVAAAEAAGAPLMAGHIERFNPALRELRRRVLAGEAGRVLSITARRMAAARVPPRDVNVVHDSAIHEIDAMRWVLGARVGEVLAAAHSGVVRPQENAVSALLRFAPLGDGPAPIGTLEVSWLFPRRVRDLTVVGTRGSFFLDYAAQTLEFQEMPPERTGPVQGWSLGRAEAGPEARPIPIEPREQLVEELKAFLGAVRNREPMPVANEDALAALAIADAITQSARTGRPVAPLEG